MVFNFVFYNLVLSVQMLYRADLPANSTENGFKKEGFW